ncbi:hypothetical protein Salat_0872100 [Sesamum alatum]|uniref:Uncharacterized protein n=1 Tax=Sesamum alatum TaxID=300844 RepID=A0AAE1YJT5_9LAMI|nr:hypothetical protein Salat_0872100 [Sesamum alatum]
MSLSVAHTQRSRTIAHTYQTRPMTRLARTHQINSTDPLHHILNSWRFSKGPSLEEKRQFILDDSIPSESVSVAGWAPISSGGNQLQENGQWTAGRVDLETDEGAEGEDGVGEEIVDFGAEAR